MIYLKAFGTHTGYEEYMNGDGIALPNVSLCEQENEVHYNPYVPPYDYSQDYFTVVVTTGGDITWTGTSSNALSYSIDNGTTWSTASSNITLSVETDDKVLWKGVTTPGTGTSNKGIGKFSGDTDVRYSVEGNAMSLLYGDDFKGQTSLEGKDFALCQLFYNNKNITSAENLSLPATTLAQQCYYSMFANCTSLTTAPKLPATTLVDYCYGFMFYGCTSLTTAPELPATTLVQDCYHGMFQGCSSLTTAPKLPATTLVDYCYGFMFYGCTSLTTAPELPATTLVQDCYHGMFQGCSSLTTAPELPATTLAVNCYDSMFYNCTSLTTAPELPATTLANDCYHSMFTYCSSLTIAPELPATTLKTQCYYAMFAACTSLNSIKCLATNISATQCTTKWVRKVASSGTFTKDANMSVWRTGEDGIPNGWTVQDAT